MDLYDHRENYFRHFGEPKYEQLLLEDELPTWPSTLRTLELVHLQKWYVLLWQWHCNARSVANDMAGELARRKISSSLLLIQLTRYST